MNYELPDASSAPSSGRSPDLSFLSVQSVQDIRKRSESMAYGIFEPLVPAQYWWPADKGFSWP